MRMTKFVPVLCNLYFSYGTLFSNASIALIISIWISSLRWPLPAFVLSLQAVGWQDSRTEPEEKHFAQHNDDIENRRF